ALLGAGAADLVHALAEADHDAVKAVVGDEHVGAEPDGEPWNTLFGCETKRFGNIVRIAGKNHHPRRSADPVGAVSRQGLVEAHLAAQPGGQRIAGSGAHPRGVPASSYHSWRHRTERSLSRSATIASQAA